MLRNYRHDVIIAMGKQIGLGYLKNLCLVKDVSNSQLSTGKLRQRSFKTNVNWTSQLPIFWKCI